MKIKEAAKLAEVMNNTLATMVNNKTLANYHAEMTLNTDDVNINLYVMPVMPLKHIKIDYKINQLIPVEHSVP